MGTRLDALVAGVHVAGGGGTEVIQHPTAAKVRQLSHARDGDQDVGPCCGRSHYHRKANIRGEPQVNTQAGARDRGGGGAGGGGTRDGGRGGERVPGRWAVGGGCTATSPTSRTEGHVPLMSRCTMCWSRVHSPCAQEHRHAHTHRHAQPTRRGQKKAGIRQKQPARVDSPRREPPRKMQHAAHAGT
jgi:hypothetical protein